MFCLNACKMCSWMDNQLGAGTSPRQLHWRPTWNGHRAGLEGAALGRMRGLVLQEPERASRGSWPTWFCGELEQVRLLGNQAMLSGGGGGKFETLTIRSLKGDARRGGTFPAEWTSPQKPPEVEGGGRLAEQAGRWVKFGWNLRNRMVRREESGDLGQGHTVRGPECQSKGAVPKQGGTQGGLGWGLGARVEVGQGREVRLRELESIFTDLIWNEVN